MATRSLPRREIAELETRWRLAGLKMVVVEGASDKQIFKQQQRLNACAPSLKEIDILVIDEIDVSSELVAVYGFATSGNKQRCVSFGRKVCDDGFGDGFRVLIDRDLDSFTEQNHSSATIIYTDYGCLDVYFWTEEVLFALLTMFQCNVEDWEPKRLTRTYDAISNACVTLSAFRLVNHFDITLLPASMPADRVVTLHHDSLEIDIEKYAEKSKVQRERREEFCEAVKDAILLMTASDRPACINGHDLMSIIFVVIRDRSVLARHAISESVVTSAFRTLGIQLTQWTSQQALNAICIWAQPA